MNLLQQELPKRFTDALTKLYNAFHNNTLDAGDCEHCAVGNLLGHGNWICSSPTQYLRQGLSYTKFKLTMCNENKSGYSLEELKMVEYYFIIGHEKHDLENKDRQFKGLCKVIEYLCELDGIENVMDFTSLFETNEKGEAIKELV